MTKTYVLRTCNADMTSRNGFVWPESGPVQCGDWEPTPECGNGLHGLLMGEGNGGLLSWASDSRWLVVEVNASDIVGLGDKVKFPSGDVVHCGDRKSATDFIIAKGADSSKCVGAFVMAGDWGTASAGDYGTASTGDNGTASAGNWGNASAGAWGTAQAGNDGTASAGYGGTASAGDWGVINIKWYDGSRYRIATGYVGEDGIEPNVPYRVVDGKLVKGVA